MREPDIEGVATHDGLESCVGAREDAGEALTEGDVGGVIEPRNQLFGVPTPSQWSEGNIAGRASPVLRTWRRFAWSADRSCTDDFRIRAGQGFMCGMHG